jgi:hypothetical protein
MVVGDGTVRSSNAISKENLHGKPNGLGGTASPIGRRPPRSRQQEVRAFIVAMKPGSINRWSEGR